MASAITSFTYKKKLTLTTTSGGANISGSLTDFPICVVVNSSSWSTAGERTHFFGAHNTDGKRVQFFASDQTTNLAYEVSKYDSGNEIATYWVKVGTVTGNSTTDVWCAYGNDPNSADQDQMTSVWVDALGIYHSEGLDGSGKVPDSGPQNNDLSDGGSSDAAGFVDRCRSYAGDDYSTGGSVGLDAASPITLSCWAKRTNSARNETFIGVGNLGTARRTLFTLDDSGWRLSAECLGIARAFNTNPGSTFAHYAATWPAGGSNLTTVKCYTNGADDTRGSVGSGNFSQFGGTNYNSIGKLVEYSDYYLIGSVDEGRIWEAEKSADWIKGEYWSMKTTTWPGDGWITWSAEENALAGQPYIKRVGGVQFMALNRGIW